MKFPKIYVSDHANDWFNDAGFWLLLMSLFSYCDVIVFHIIMEAIHGRIL